MAKGDSEGDLILGFIFDWFWMFPLFIAGSILVIHGLYVNLKEKLNPSD